MYLRTYILYMEYVCVLGHYSQGVKEGTERAARNSVNDTDNDRRTGYEQIFTKMFIMDEIKF